MLFIYFEGYSQIKVDFQTSLVNLTPIKLSNTETKYLDQPGYWTTQNHFTLYNLDGSPYKTIQMPPKPDPSALIEIVDFITNSLFDNDSSNIEYLVHYDPCDSLLSGAPWRVKIIREDGTVLLDEAYASYSGLQIYNTEQGVKLMLPYYTDNSILYKKIVFSLPGKLPSGVEKNYLNETIKPSLYPNPNSGTFFINVNSKLGESATIDLYSITGKLLRSYKSDSKIIQINESGLSNGVYIINTQTNQGFQRTKMIIQK